MPWLRLSKISRHSQGPTSHVTGLLIYKVLQFSNYIVSHIQWSEFKTPRNPTPSSTDRWSGPDQPRHPHGSDQIISTQPKAQGFFLLFTSPHLPKSILHNLSFNQQCCLFSAPTQLILTLVTMLQVIKSQVITGCPSQKTVGVNYGITTECSSLKRAALGVGQSRKLWGQVNYSLSPSQTSKHTLILWTELSSVHSRATVL